MVYYCEKCKKYHADAYKVHLKYKRTDSKKPTDLDDIKEDIRKIKELLRIWGNWISRKHPYWNIDDEFKVWTQ